jgi:hypothetical protein
LYAGEEFQSDMPAYGKDLFAFGEEPLSKINLSIE